ncbi:MAG: hypothetical protein QOJ40_2457 [Verrucomicrobiota bacterium]
MSPDDERRFEELRRFFFNLNTDLIMAYCLKDPPASGELKWCRAASALDRMTREGYNAAAAYYHDLANWCFKQRKNLMTREYIGTDPPLRFLGLTVRKPKPRPGPLNASGQGWWTLVVGVGPLRNAGYVMVARTAAKKAGELQVRVQQVYEIFGAENLALWPRGALPTPRRDKLSWQRISIRTGVMWISRPGRRAIK